MFKLSKAARSKIKVKLFAATAIGVFLASLPWSLVLVIVSGWSLLFCFPACSLIVMLYIWKDVAFTYRLVSG
jgi:hypothetical protein